MHLLLVYIYIYSFLLVVVRHRVTTVNEVVAAPTAPCHSSQEHTRCGGRWRCTTTRAQARGRCRLGSVLTSQQSHAETFISDSGAPVACRIFDLGSSSGDCFVVTCMPVAAPFARPWASRSPGLLTLHARCMGWPVSMARCSHPFVSKRSERS